MKKCDGGYACNKEATTFYESEDGYPVSCCRHCYDNEMKSRENEKITWTKILGRSISEDKKSNEIAFRNLDEKRKILNDRS